VRLVLENEADYRTLSECFRSISKKIGCSPETLRDWVNKQAVETGDREGLTQSERAQMKELQRKTLPEKWPEFRDTVTDYFRVISLKEYKVI
jgi:transposase